MNDRIMVRAGVDIAETARLLRTLAMQARNTIGRSPDIGIVRDSYLQWVDDAESQLRSRFVSEAIWQALHSERYWRIRDLREDSPRPFPVIASEVAWQADRLEAIVTELERTHAQLQAPPDCVLVVPDTN